MLRRANRTLATVVALCARARASAVVQTVNLAKPPRGAGLLQRRTRRAVAAPVAQQALQGTGRAVSATLAFLAHTQPGHVGIRARSARLCHRAAVDARVPQRARLTRRLPRFLLIAACRAVGALLRVIGRADLAGCAELARVARPLQARAAGGAHTTGALLSRYRH